MRSARVSPLCSVMVEMSAKYRGSAVTCTSAFSEVAGVSTPHTGCSLLRKSRGGALSLDASRYYVSLTAYARQPPTNFGRGKAGKSFPASPRLISVKSRFSCPFSTNVPQCCCEPWITTQDTAKMSVASIYPRCVSNQPAKASMPR